jgi:hypothetical protein
MFLVNIYKCVLMWLLIKVGLVIIVVLFFGCLIWERMWELIWELIFE